MCSLGAEPAKKLESFDEITRRHFPVDGVKSIAARTKPALCVNAQIWKQGNEWFNEMNRLWSKTAGRADAERREVLPDGLRQRDELVSVQATTPAQAFIK